MGAATRSRRAKIGTTATGGGKKTEETAAQKLEATEEVPTRSAFRILLMSGKHCGRKETSKPQTPSKTSSPGSAFVSITRHGHGRVQTDSQAPQVESDQETAMKGAPAGE